MKLLGPRRLGLIRDFLKLRDYFLKLSLPDSRQDSTVTPFSGSFREAKAVRIEIEAKGAKTMCHVQRMMAAPR